MSRASVNAAVVDAMRDVRFRTTFEEKSVPPEATIDELVASLSTEAELRAANPQSPWDCDRRQRLPGVYLYRPKEPRT